MKVITGRSLEAIKGKRRGKPYKKMVEDLVEALLLNPMNQDTATEENGSLMVNEETTSNLVPEPLPEPEIDIVSSLDVLGGETDPVGGSSDVLVEETSPTDGCLDVPEEETNYKMDESTIICESVEKYVQALNEDQRP